MENPLFQSEKNMRPDCDSKWKLLWKGYMLKRRSNPVDNTFFYNWLSPKYDNIINLIHLNYWICFTYQKYRCFAQLSVLQNINVLSFMLSLPKIFIKHILGCLFNFYNLLHYKFIKHCVSWNNIICCDNDITDKLPSISFP